MRVVWSAPTLGLAVVLLGTACSGQPKGAVRDLGNDDPSVRSDAAIHLGQARSKEAVDALIAALNDQEESVRVNVIRALGDVGDPKAIPAIVPFVGDFLSAVRMAACQALGALRDPRGVPALEKALYDGDESIRVVAARALGDVPGPESLEVLLRVALRDESALRAESEMVRANAAMAKVDLSWALGSLGDRSGMATLRTLLFKGDPEDVRAEAAIALGELGDASELPVLERALADKMGLVRNRVAEAIDKLKGLKAA